MKLIEIYEKSNLDELMIDDRSIKKIMDNFFYRYPLKYRKNYDRNLKSVELCKTNGLYDQCRALYYPDSNRILFLNEMDVAHELMHLAHYDRKKDLLAIESNDSMWVTPLIEGAAEYLANQATGYEVLEYVFETFVICMLSEINDFFEPFFIPNYHKFIKLFSDKRDILSLMYALNYYYINNQIDIEGEDNLEIVNKVHMAVKEVIDCLIKIEKSMSLSYREEVKYSEKFMDLITSKKVSSILLNFFPEYEDYSYKEIKRKILTK